MKSHAEVAAWIADDLARAGSPVRVAIWPVTSNVARLLSVGDGGA